MCASSARARCSRGGSRSSAVESEDYFLACMRYIELNPVRAGIASSPAGFTWSRYRENASGDPKGLLRPHGEYLRLGAEPASRGAAYRALFSEVLPAETLATIRTGIAANKPLRGAAVEAFGVRSRSDP